MVVLDKNACRNCRRPIEKLTYVGWVHGELPQYASEKITCTSPQPVDPRCLACGELVASSNWHDGQVRLGRHGDPLCVGSSSLQSRPE